MKKLLLLVLSLCVVCAKVYSTQIDGLNYYLIENPVNGKFAALQKGDVPYSGIIVIPENVIYNNKTYKVTDIWSEAFKDCTDVTDVSIPSTLTSIGDGAFKGCTGLTAIDLKNVRVIRSQAFSGCTSLKEVKLGESLEHIYYSVFWGCDNIVSIKLPKSLKTLGDYVFANCKNLKTISMGNSIERMGRMVFSGCTSLNNVILPSLISEIDLGLFSGCKSLNNIYLGNNIEIIGGNAFYNCQNLKSIIIPNSVKAIQSSAFEKCSHLSVITIGCSVEAIGKSAFYGSEDLSTVYCLMEKLPSAFAKTFGSISKSATLFVPSSAVDLYKHSAPWASFKEIEPTNFYPALLLKDGVVFEKLKDLTLTLAFGDDYSDKYRIPETITLEDQTFAVTKIKSEAFMGNEDLKTIIIPNSIKEIGDKSFADCCNLNEIYCHAKSPIILGNINSTSPLTRAEETTDKELSVFAGVDKDVCILYVPKGCSDKYKKSLGWKDFKNIIEMNNNVKGDANGDGIVDSSDINCIVSQIIGNEPDDFTFDAADTNNDGHINAADIVEIANIILKQL